MPNNRLAVSLVSSIEPCGFTTTPSGRLSIASWVVRWVRSSFSWSIRRKTRSWAAIALNATASRPSSSREWTGTARSRLPRSISWTEQVQRLHRAEDHAAEQECHEQRAKSDAEARDIVASPAGPAGR